MEFYYLILAVVLLLSACLTAIESTHYQGCIGSTQSCCSKIELYPGDSLRLNTLHHSSGGAWCDRVIIARRTREKYDECTGCTFNVKFLDHSTPFLATVELLEANYSTTSYWRSETLSLTELAAFGANTGKPFPASIDTTSTVLKLFFGEDTSHYGGRLSILITPNTPPRSSNIGLILGVSIPMLVLFIALYVVAYKIRQRRIARLRAMIQARVTAVVVDAALDAEALRQARARQRARHPQSPDPQDSMAPPSYTEATPPPKYEDVVLSSMQSLPHTTAPQTTDPAAPDTGHDTDMLVV